jgi:PhnB protein
MRAEPYIYFNGRCEEAVEFYRRVLGAQVVLLTRNEDVPGSHAPASAGKKILHVELKIGESRVMASDGENSGITEFKGIAMALTVQDDAEARSRFDALADGGAVALPLMPTPFSSSFGMASDRFGILWMVSVGQ